MNKHLKKSSARIAMQSIGDGFTLIELLVLVAVDPAEQFNRAEDANRKQTVNTLGNSISQYITSRATLASPDLTSMRISALL